jgi:hypothetical protein
MPKKFIKGSEEAKEFMKNLRMKRKTKGGAITAPEISVDIPASETEDTVVGTGMKTNKNSWISHVQKYAKEHQMSYFKAIKQPDIKDTYKK